MFILQTTDFHFANYRFSFRKLQIPISRTTDFHSANYRFPFRFVPFRFANYSKPCDNEFISKLNGTKTPTLMHKVELYGYSEKTFKVNILREQTYSLWCRSLMRFEIQISNKYRTNIDPTLKKADLLNGNESNEIFLTLEE